MPVFTFFFFSFFPSWGAGLTKAVENRGDGTEETKQSDANAGKEDKCKSSLMLEANLQDFLKGCFSLKSWL